jgi:hypothetical protein
MIEEADGKIRDIRFPRVRAYSPDAHRVDTPSGTWLLWLPWGHGPRSLLEFLENTPSAQNAARKLCGVSPEITGVFVPCGTGRNPLAFRSLSSGFELFCLQAPGGGIILTDFFRDALALLPREERQLEITGIADYLLAQCPLDEQTLVRGISRLPSGALWEWTTAGVPPRRSIIESLEDLLEETPHPSVVEALSSAMDPLSGSRGIALLFSGGIDSALIGSFLDPETEALTALAPPPELAFEHSLAREGARFLGLRRVREIPFAEERFLDDLSAAIRTAGLPVPCPNFQAIFHEKFFLSPHAAYCSGDTADSLFGYRHVEQGQEEESEWTGILDELFPEGGFLRELGIKGLFSGARPAVDFLGPGVVSGRLRDRHRLLAEQVGDLSGISGPFDLSAEWGHLAWVLCNPYWRHYFRQQATAFGKSLVCPFAQRDVMRAALSLPMEARSPKGGPLKALLRNLLAKRVPGYPVDRPKGGNGVPRTRYCTTGPLAGFFDERSCPRALPPGILPLLRKPAWKTSGAVMNMAVLKLWEESCLETENPVPRPPRLTLP